MTREPELIRPKAVVLMPQATFEKQFLGEQLERLRTLCDVVEPCPAENLFEFSDAPGTDAVEVLITGWGTPRISKDVVQKFPRLSLVAHCAGSLKQVADGAILSNGVRMTSCAAANAQPVAEYTLANILLWNKRQTHWVSRYRAERDRFRRAERFEVPHAGNRGQTVGIIGASRVGRHLISLLRPFDFDIVVYDPIANPDEVTSWGVSNVSLGELMTVSDVISVNAPSLPSTAQMIAAPQLALMRDGALLINTARGELIDHDALIDELKTGRISALLDVTKPEPLPADSPLFDMENVILTPHIAGSIGREVHRMTSQMLSELELYIREQRLEFEVSAENWSFAA